MRGAIDELPDYESSGLVVITSLAIMLITLIPLHCAVQQKKLPPGPVAWPMVGSFLDIIGALLNGALQSLAVKYGGFMFLHLDKCASISTLAASPAQVVTVNTISKLVQCTLLYWSFAEEFLFSEQLCLPSSIVDKACNSENYMGGDTTTL